jgi:hypothetical protein
MCKKINDLAFVLDKWELKLAPWIAGAEPRLKGIITNSRQL